MHVQEEEGTVKSQIDDEEDKEQNSPVSVLDPPFEDDEDGHRREEDDHELEERNDYDLECSYAFVQRAKKKLLHKLHRFEKLAELDPVELEKRLLEEDDEEDEDDSVEKEDEGECEEKEEEDREDSLIKDVFCQLGYQGTLQPGMKMLVTHLIDEEKDVDGLKKHSNDGLETAVKRACKRLKSWQKDEANTIDLMMKMDLAGESDDWRRPPEQITEVSMEIEVEMLVLLVNEMLEELNES